MCKLLFYLHPLLCPLYLHFLLAIKISQKIYYLVVKPSAEKVDLSLILTAEKIQFEM